MRDSLNKRLDAALVRYSDMLRRAEEVLVMDKLELGRLAGLQRYAPVGTPADAAKIVCDAAIGYIICGPAKESANHDPGAAAKD